MQADGARPLASRYLVQRRIEAEHVEASIAMIAQNYLVFVMTALAELADQDVNVLRNTHWPTCGLFRLAAGP